MKPAYKLYLEGFAWKNPVLDLSCDVFHHEFNPRQPHHSKQPKAFGVLDIAPTMVVGVFVSV